LWRNCNDSKRESAEVERRTRKIKKQQIFANILPLAV
jgi:hypothetical protein